MKRPAVPGHLRHPFENVLGPRLVFRLARLQQAVRERIEVFDTGIGIRHARERRDRLSIFPFLHKTATQNAVDADVAGTFELSLLSKIDRLVEPPRPRFRHRQIDAGAWDILKIEGALIQRDRLRISGFDRSQIGKLPQSGGDQAFVRQGYDGNVAGVPGRRRGGYPD